MTRVPVARVVLVGFMGAGKSTVGRALAEALGWRFVDLDDEIERAAGRTVAEIFDALGESAFRRMEAEAAERALATARVVIAPGGGWAAEPGRLESVPEGTVSVWLQVEADEAVRRTAEDARERPLLASNDRVERARSILSTRTSQYARADFRVDTDGSSVEDVTASILDWLAPQRIDTQAE